jgi:hypothetical protein
MVRLFMISPMQSVSMKDISARGGIMMFVSFSTLTTAAFVTHLQQGPSIVPT